MQHVVTLLLIVKVEVKQGRIAHCALCTYNININTQNAHLNLTPVGGFCVFRSSLVDTINNNQKRSNIIHKNGIVRVRLLLRLILISRFQVQVQVYRYSVQVQVQCAMYNQSQRSNNNNSVCCLFLSFPLLLTSLQFIVFY